jgi:hypothetical protein
VVRSVTANALLARAAAAGVQLRVAPGGTVQMLAKLSAVPPDLLAVLRAHKAELASLLTGNTCRWCGEPMGWPGPAGVVLANGTAMHARCGEEFHVERIKRLAENAFSREAMADQAETMIHGRII